MAEKYYCDVLVIGTGISGLSAAVTAADKGKSVIVLTKEDDVKICNTNFAQGGIVAEAPGDDPKIFKSDILHAGDGINYIEAVNYIANEGVKLIKPFLIDKINVDFTRDSSGDLEYTIEGAHSERRILFVKDNSGEAIEKALIDYIKKLKNVKLLTSYTAIDLITNKRHSRDYQERYKSVKVLGAYCLNETSGNVEIIFSSSVILACGGIGDLFTFTSNEKGAVGDGLAMAEKAGADIINSEYVQFHPTILFNRDIKRFLISEAVRGEGARLCNRKGEYFMEKYSPDFKDLASRDVVARAIYREIENDDAGYVFLDARNITNVDVSRRFPKIYKTCLNIGIDMKKDLIPVVAAAHYFCGGILVDISGRTSIDGLWAVGECSCTGVHGANRLASVSLLEGVVWGINAGNDVASFHVTDDGIFKSIPDWIYPEVQEKSDPIHIYQDRSMIRKIMWNYCGIIRSQKRLTRALADLEYLSRRIDQFYRSVSLPVKLSS